MSNENGRQTTGGIGVAGAFLVAFVVLKLTNTIEWSWWWVLCPLWIPICLILLVLIVVGVIALLGNSTKK